MWSILASSESENKVLVAHVISRSMLLVTNRNNFALITQSFKVVSAPINVLFPVYHSQKAG